MTQARTIAAITILALFAQLCPATAAAADHDGSAYVVVVTSNGIVYGQLDARSDASRVVIRSLGQQSTLLQVIPATDVLLLNFASAPAANHVQAGVSHATAASNLLFK